MCLIIPKCKALNIYRKKIPTKREYQLNGSPLATFTEIKNLATVTYALQWSQNIKLISSKANRTHGIIRRVCRDINDPDIKKLFYCSIVRPQLARVRLWTMVTLLNWQAIARKRSAQGHKIYLELFKGYVL